MGQRKPQARRQSAAPRATVTSSVTLLERDDEPVPILNQSARMRAQRAVSDDERDLAEFRDFFITSRPDLVALQPQPATPPAATKPRRRHNIPHRVAAATAYIGHLAIIRPEVPLPWLRLPGWAFRSHGAPAPRRMKLPPLWLLANIAIAVALLVAITPQVIMSAAQAGCEWYTVQPGDNLTSVSQAYGVEARDITTANHIADPDLITVDERLCIPVSTIAASLEAFVGVVAHPAAPGAPAHVRAFIAFTLPYAREASKQTGWPISMILAQWGLETSWRVKTFTGYNWGNCGAMPNEPAIPGTSAPGSPLAFAYAYTPEQGVEEYVHVAHLRYYTGVAAADRSGGPDAAARALGASPWDWGHYTDIGSPGSSIIALMRAYNLYWYDKFTP